MQSKKILLILIVFSFISCDLFLPQDVDNNIGSIDLEDIALATPPQDIDNVVFKNWMYTYRSSLENFKISELAIPGAHDSGAYDMQNSFFVPWTQTQNINVSQQLEYGIRALDMRIGLEPAQTNVENKFILVHDTYKTNVTLKNYLQQVLTFSKDNPFEIIILDFHRFVNFGNVSETHYTQLVTKVKNTIDDNIIDPSDKDLSLKQLWEKKGRIIVAWNRANKDASFWSGIPQKWYNKQGKSELKKSIEKEMKNTHSGLWSISAVLTPSVFQPLQALNPDISQWFAFDGSWAKKANIVSIDFVEKTQLPQHLIMANVKKSNGP